MAVIKTALGKLGGAGGFFIPAVLLRIICGYVIVKVVLNFLGFVMATITFDTHRFVRKLEEAGFDQKQAEGLTEAMRSAIEESELVTKKDLQIELAPIKADLNLLKWMMGALIAIAIANFSKQFF